MEPLRDWVVWLNTPGYPAWETPNVLRVRMSLGGLQNLIRGLVPESFPGACYSLEREGVAETCYFYGKFSDIDVEPVHETGLFSTGVEGMSTK